MLKHVPKHGVPGHVLTVFGGFRHPYSGHTYMLARRVLRTHKQWLVGKKVRERGTPERINRTALGAMMARGPLHDGIVLLFPLRGRSP